LPDASNDFRIIGNQIAGRTPAGTELLFPRSIAVATSPFQTGTQGTIEPTMSDSALAPTKPAPTLLRSLGPGLVTGAADDDPSGIATYSQAGAQFGYGLLWTVFLTLPFMIAIQLVSAQIGRVTGKGLAANVMAIAPRWAVLALVGMLVAANTFNIAADIAAMAEALSLVIGGLNHEHALIFAAGSTLLQVFLPYRRYSPVLKFLTLALFAYVATAFTVEIPWRTALLAAVWPKTDVSADYFMMVVAVLGTTISPYLFFWQASQEVEEMNCNDRPPLRKRPRGGSLELDRIKVDTSCGMLLSNSIAFFIILTTASVLNAHGVTNINSATEAAEALRPLAGDFTFALFALGIIGTGLLAIPVLAGSAAYGVAEIFGWHATLEAKPDEAVGFYTIIAAATAIGFGLGFTGIDSIHMLVWSAVLNGIVAVPIMAMMMLIVSSSEIMGRFRARSWLVALGWLGTALMTLAVLALFGSFALR
jgi:NRAMP (natural resistance-associated macrophage protein)-like metal ion transporter